MNLFENLLKIKTKKENLVIKAVYIKNSSLSQGGSYFLYYYDMLHNTFYINDLDYVGVQDRTSAINIIEQIVSRAYKLEMNSFIDIIKKIQITKNPKVYYFYRQKSTKLIIMDRVLLTPIKNSADAIIRFKNPKWDNSDSQKFNEKNV